MEKIEIYNKLSEYYDELFIKNVQSFKEAAYPNRNYAVFYPSFGLKKDERCEFLFYGQSIKGWKPEFSTNDNLDYDQLIKESIEYSNSFCKEKYHSPLDWVNIYWSNRTYNDYINSPDKENFYPPEMTYRTFRSFFWNVVYKLVSSYYRLDSESFDWSKKIVWSNLYKIAPAERKNPNDEECEFQKCAFELVKNEIEELNPKFCIVLTNESWWKPFQNNLNTKVLQENKLPSKIVCREKYKQTEIIVTTRALFGDNDELVKQILSLIK